MADGCGFVQRPRPSPSAVKPDPKVELKCISKPSLGKTAGFPSASFPFPTTVAWNMPKKTLSIFELVFCFLWESLLCLKLAVIDRKKSYPFCKKYRENGEKCDSKPTDWCSSNVNIPQPLRNRRPWRTRLKIQLCLCSPSLPIVLSEFAFFMLELPRSAHDCA